MSLFALIQRPICVSHRFHLACTLKSLLLSSLVVCFVVLWWFGLVAFVVWHFMQETLSKTTQADLCISCINGASTRAKKRHQDSQEGLTPGGLEASAGSPSITAGLVGVAFSMALKKRFRENNTKGEPFFLYMG